MFNRAAIISEWFRQYSHDVFDFLVYYTGSLDVEDLVQEVFIKAFKGLKSYKGQSKPKTWLFSIARNVAIDEARKRKKKFWQATVPFDERLGPNDGETPEKILHQNEEKQELYRSIRKLKSSYRDVVLLRGIQNLSVAETAEVLNWKEGKVRTNYHRALKSLRKQEGGTADDE
ncbi:RNA polymerase sigma factor [Bacillus sp. AK031]